MPIPCKAEVFNRDLTFKSMSPIGDPAISYDYLTLEPTKVICPSISAAKGDFIVISQGLPVYYGIVDDVEISKGVELSVKPLLSIFDCEVHFDRTQSHSLESFLAGIITANWGNNADTLQNLPGLTVTTTSTTTGYLNLKDNFHNFYEIITKCLTGYGVVVSVALDPRAGAVSVTIGKVSATATIETDLKSIASRVLTIGDSFGAPNKITLYNEADETQTATYYLHTDGTVTQTDSDRISPVFPTVEKVTVEEGGTFSAAAMDAARAALKPSQFDNNIEVTIPDSCRTVDASMAIGTECTILANGSAYKSILTGYERSDKATTLIFGVVRVDLTKKLIIERRRSK